MLQVHIRDLNAFKETRYTLLGLRPSHRVNWIAYAIAHHLLKEYDVAIKLLDQLRVMDTVCWLFSWKNIFINTNV